MVPILFTFVKPKMGSSILLLLASLAFLPIVGYGEMVITPVDEATIPRGVAKITLMVPKGGCMVESLWRSNLDCSL